MTDEERIEKAASDRAHQIAKATSHDNAEEYRETYGIEANAFKAGVRWRDENPKSFHYVITGVDVKSGPQWISVKDKLPDSHVSWVNCVGTNDSYINYPKDHPDYAKVRVHCGKWDGRNWMSPYQDQWNRHEFLFNVTHWMPLPPLPKSPNSPEE